MRINFESFSALQYRNKALSRQVEEFKSGEKYIKMEADYKKLLRFHSQEMKRMKQELAKAHSETVTGRSVTPRGKNKKSGKRKPGACQAEGCGKG